MIVTFYKTKLSANNRCYDGAAYENYLNSCKKKAVTLKYDIIPNANFYLPLVTADNQWQLYNYITFEYAGLKYGSFILSIQPLATDSTIEVRHTTDNWYYVMVNGLNVDFHGQCVRAHVNDLKDGKQLYTYNADLSNTLHKPEEQVSSFGFTADCQRINPLEEYRYVYMLINNPNQTGISYPNGKKTQRVISAFDVLMGSNDYLVCPQLILFGLIDKDGNISFATDGTTEVCIENGNIKAEYMTKIENIQSDVVTNMLLTEVPMFPIINGSVMKANNGYYFHLESKTFNKGTIDEYTLTPDDITFKTSFSNLAGMPTNAMCFTDLDTAGKTVKFKEYVVGFKIYNSVTPIKPKDDYNDYITNGIVKMHMSDYNVCYILDNFVDYNYMTIPEEYGHFVVFSSINMSLQNVDYYLDYTELTQGYSSGFSENINSSFTPSVTRSYFDRYDLSIASLNASKKIVNSGFDVANGLISGVSSFAKGLSNPAKAAEGMVGILQGGVNTVQATVNLEYTKKIENLTLEKTQGQITNGKISSNTPIGYYSIISRPTYNSYNLLTLNETGIKQLTPLLHRYGYNTVLQLDEVYTKHRRKYFNYIQTEDCDVNGVPLDIANDIENMFNSGVHLWSGEVEKWDVPNWQKDVRYYTESETGNNPTQA